MSTADLHAGLRSEVVATANASGVALKLARLQHGKDSFTYSLHASPSSFSSAGLQTTDLLRFLGFHRMPCTFVPPECYATAAREDFDLQAFGTAFVRFGQVLERTERDLQTCGFLLPQPEGWGYFHGKPSGTRRDRAVGRASGDGHRAPQVKRMKESTDANYRYALTWIDGGGDRGWVTHYLPKDEAAMEQLTRATSLLGGMSQFHECPEFDFQSCHWRFEPFEARSNAWGDNADIAHSHFDAHANHFAAAIYGLMEADSIAASVGFSFLPERATRSLVTERTDRPRDSPSIEAGETRDVFLCHASEDKPSVLEPLVRALTENGVSFWYDQAEIRWGDSLPKKVNGGIRISRYVVVVLSPWIVGKHWPERELYAAINLEAKSGEVKVLPLLVGTDLEIGEILAAYPLLNDKFFVRWQDGLDAIVDALKARLGR